MTELDFGWGGVHHPWLFQALWIKAVTKRHTILQIRQSKAYVLGHIDQEKLIFWFTSAVDDHNMKPQAWQGERRAVALPALLPQTIKLPRRASCYTLAHCMQHQCVYWIWGPVINKFSIFFPPRCLANIKGGKGWCGISVPEPSTVWNSPAFSPKTQAGSSRANSISWLPGFYLAGRAVVHAFL